MVFPSLENFKVKVLIYNLDNQRKKEYVILEARLSALYKNPAKDIVVKAKIVGKNLAGKKYTPIFPYFEKVFIFPAH